MNIQTARRLLSEPMDRMDLETLQRHKVRLLDAWRESKADYGFPRAVKDGFFKILESDSASGYVPSDFWLTHNLAERYDQACALEQELLNSLTPEEFAATI